MNRMQEKIYRSYRISLLFIPPDDPSLVEIVGRELDGHLIAGKDADKIHSQLAADMSKNLMSVVQSNLKHCIRQFLDYSSFNFNNISF